MTSISPPTRNIANTVPVREADDTRLETLSREGTLSLTLAEMKAVQTYFRGQGRDPTDVELETIAQTWSEHCLHKTLKGRFAYIEPDVQKTAPLAGKTGRRYENLLKETIAAATEQLRPTWCLSVFKDNAGVIDFDGTDAVSFKVETHNHPSALEPYGGAGTGVGGVIRDILGCGLGGKPIMNTDVFCFGPLETKRDACPPGALPPARIAEGVIAGVRDYGNRMGIPTANGTVYFDPGYTGNPLVFCGTIGLMSRAAVGKSVHSGDLVVVVGGRTGRDGIHGATFSSAPLEKGITSNVVQIGHAIMEKKTMDALLQAQEKNLYRSVTDCGAGGFSSAIGELGEQTGVRVDLSNVPLKYPGLVPWEIWLSESQERMVLAVPPENWNSLKVLFQQEDVEAVAIGEFTNDNLLRIFFGETLVGELEMAFLHGGVPPIHLKAEWRESAYRKRHQHDLVPTPSPPANDFTAALKWLLGHPVIASKQSVTRQYDHEVQGGLIVKPYMGVDHDGPVDAAVMRPKLNSWKGVAVSNGLQPQIGKWDPYLSAKFAVDEAYRNMIAVGGGLKYAAILDNFCWGDVTDPLELAALVRAAEGAKEAAIAYKLPFISGKDSLNNTWKAADGSLKSIPPTLLISAVGILEDVKTCLTAGLKKSGSLVYLIGGVPNAWKGSILHSAWGDERDALPGIDFDSALTLYKRLQSVYRFRGVLSCHDVSEGGLAVCAAEMAFGSALGMDLQAPDAVRRNDVFLFSESPARFLVEVDSSVQAEFEQAIGPGLFALLGETTEKAELKIRDHSSVLIHETIPVLKKIWKESLQTL